MAGWVRHAEPVAVQRKDAEPRLEHCAYQRADLREDEDLVVIEEPVQIAAHQNWFIGSVGNLTFDVAVTYLGERLPPDVEQRNLAIFRDFVLAVIESKELVE